MYSIFCSCGKEYKDETIQPLKVMLEEYCKAVVRCETIKLGMPDHGRERVSPTPVEWGKILDRRILANQTSEGVSMHVMMTSLLGLA